jgi:hypothetical protein
MSQRSKKKGYKRSGQIGWEAFLPKPKQKHGAFNYRKDCRKKWELNLEGIVLVASARGLNAGRLMLIGPEGR